MFNIPNLFTAFNMLSGCAAIILTFAGRIDLAPFAIFAGAFFDFLDGFLARKLKVSGEMGKQLDSLADMVTFGVAPGLIMLVMLIQVNIHFSSGRPIEAWLNSLLNMEWKAFFPLIALLIPFFSIFRLAKFNLDTRQTESFIGLPTPANTLFFMSFPLVAVYGSNNSDVMSSINDFMFHPITMGAFILTMSLLLVSEIPLFSLKFKTFGIKGNETRYIFLLISLTFIMIFKVWALALIVFLYLVLSIIENFVLKTKKDEI
ncbi:MAG: hypothetical protein CSA03_04455 [Bacteroidetes bacterium]|nr:MAG: hypothetical protein CSA03_04455 [Bacteroidota bacterium]